MNAIYKLAWIVGTMCELLYVKYILEFFYIVKITITNIALSIYLLVYLLLLNLLLKYFYHLIFVTF